MHHTKTVDLPNYRKLMREVQLNDMTPEGAAAIIDEHIRLEVARRLLNGPDVELALHPMTTVQDCADRAARDHERFGDRMVAVLLGEYALLRRRLADDRLRAMAETAPAPTQAPAKNGEQKLFDTLRILSQTAGKNNG